MTAPVTPNISSPPPPSKIDERDARPAVQIPAPSAPEVQKPDAKPYVHPKVAEHFTNDQLRTAAEFQREYHNLLKDADFIDRYGRYHSGDPYLRKFRLAIKNRRLKESKHKGYGPDRSETVDFIEFDEYDFDPMPEAEADGTITEEASDDKTELTTESREESDAHEIGDEQSEKADDQRDQDMDADPTAQEFHDPDSESYPHGVTQDFAPLALTSRHKTLTKIVQREARKRPSLLQLVFLQPERADALEAYLYVLEQCRLEKWDGRLEGRGAILGIAARKFSLPNVRKALDAIEKLLNKVQQIRPKFSRSRFLGKAREEFAERRKSAAWSMVQQRTPPPAPPTASERPGAAIGPIVVKNKPKGQKTKRDRPTYGTQFDLAGRERSDVRSIMTKSRTDLVPAAPATMERSAFRHFQRGSEERREPLPFVRPSIFRTVVREKLRRLRKGLDLFLESLPANYVGKDKKEFLSIVSGQERGWTIERIANDLDLSRRTVHNRIDYLLKLAGDESGQTAERLTA